MLCRKISSFDGDGDGDGDDDDYNEMEDNIEYKSIANSKSNKDKDEDKNEMGGNDESKTNANKDKDDVGYESWTEGNWCWLLPNNKNPTPTPAITTKSTFIIIIDGMNYSSDLLLIKKSIKPQMFLEAIKKINSILNNHNDDMQQQIGK